MTLVEVTLSILCSKSVLRGTVFSDLKTCPFVDSFPGKLESIEKHNASKDKNTTLNLRD